MAVEYKDYYKTLEVSRTATEEEIKKAYRKLARRHDPNVNPNDKSAEDKFKEVQEAYEVLGDKEKRKRYDQLGQNWKDGSNFTPPPGWQGGGFRTDFDPSEMFNSTGGGFGGRGGGFSDFFESIFGQATGGGSRQAPRHGARRRRGRQEVDTELGLPLEELHRGTTRKLNLSAGDQAKTVEVRIPPGARDGSKIRVAGGGFDGGDLFIQLKQLPGARFTVDGDDTEIEVPISPWEAALGATIQVATMDGVEKIKVPAGVGSGQRVRLKEKGLNKRGGGRGDHFVRLRIVVPKELTESEREHFEGLASSSTFNPRS